MTALSGQLASAFPKEDKGRSALHRSPAPRFCRPMRCRTSNWITAVLIGLAVLVLLSRAPTSPTCCWPSPWGAGQEQRSSSRSARRAAGSVANLLRKPAALHRQRRCRLRHGRRRRRALLRFTVVFPMRGALLRSA